MRKLVIIFMLTFAVNAFADNYGMTDTQQKQEDMKNTADSPNGYACDSGKKC